jgi:predicted dehydrogenase
VSPKTINIGLIGTGFMGKGHSMAYRMLPMIFNPPPALPKLEVVADVTPEMASRAADDYGFAGWTTDWREVVDNPRVDVVDITAPNHLHHEIAVAAAQSGKHVYCEKPLALTAASAKEMLEAVVKAGVRTMVGFNYLKNPAALMARQLIESGELGEIWHFRGEFHQDILADPQVPFSWRFERKLAGSGALGDLAAHVIAMAQFLVGDFASVCGTSRTFIGERPVAAGAYGYDLKARTDGETRTVENEDSVHFLIDFRNGASGTIASSRVARGRKVYLAYEVNGSKGSLHFVHERMNEISVYLSSDPEGLSGFRRVLVGPEHPYYRSFWPVAGVGLGFSDTKVIEIFELLDGLANDKPISPGFREGWKVSQAIDAVLLSVQERRWVEVDSVC